MTKYKKMTLKEFKAAFEAVGFNFEIWGWDGILNLIACEEQMASERSARVGCNACAQHELELSEMIEKLLRDRGYYNRHTWE